jgi:hypothetical protein
MPRPRKKKKRRGVPEQRKVQCDASTLALLDLLRREFTSWRDDTIKKIEREQGFRVRHAGQVETRVEPYEGTCSLAWNCFQVAKK